MEIQIERRKTKIKIYFIWLKTEQNRNLNLCTINTNKFFDSWIKLNLKYFCCFSARKNLLAWKLLCLAEADTITLFAYSFERVFHWNHNRIKSEMYFFLLNVKCTYSRRFEIVKCRINVYNISFSCCDSHIKSSLCRRISTM